MIRFNRNTINNVAKLIAKPANVSVIMHTNPDGDAVGSALAMHLILKKLGHNSCVISPDQIAGFLHWIPGMNDVYIHSDQPEKAEKVLKKSEIIIIVDFNSPKRSANLENLISHHPAKKILIDHHPDPDCFAEYSFSYTDVSSTAELIYQLLKKLNLVKYIDKEIAECLFTGIMTDTGSFSFATNNPSTFAVVSELLKYGINQEKIQSKVYHNFSVNRQQLMGFCLNKKLEYFRKYNTAIISLNKEELIQYKHQIGDTEGFVNLPLQINGVVFSALFIEKENEIKISFRSKGNFSVNEFAHLHFNGGGHKNAAGGYEYNLSLEKTLQKFRDLLPQFEKQLNEKFD